MNWLSHTCVGAFGVLVGMVLTLLVSRCEPERPPPITEGRCVEITPSQYRGVEARGDTRRCAWRQRMWGCSLVAGSAWLIRDRWFCEASQLCRSTGCLEEIPR